MITCRYTIRDTLISQAEQEYIDLSIQACTAVCERLSRPGSRFAGLAMTIDVLFGDAADMEDHDAADAGALGLYYVAQACPEDGEYDICGHFLCIVDVPANLAAIRDNLTDAASIQAAAVTAPHEIVHAVQFALQTGGRTPIQVFDEDGEDAFFELARRRRDDAGSEDEAERLARASTDHLSTHRLEALLRKTVDS